MANELEPSLYFNQLSDLEYRTKLLYLDAKNHPIEDQRAHQPQPL